MSTSILSTKLYVPPPRPRVVPRSRLIERIDAGLPGKLTLISAAAGFGKTTLVSAWASGCGLPAAWLSLDEGDSDPTRFLAYLIAALQTVAPAVGQSALAALHASPPPVEAILAAVLNDLAALPERLILVLDDYHVLDAPAVDQALAFLLQNQPPSLHLVIATREDPPLPLARLRARGQLTELRAADLRFTAGEAAEFLNRTIGLGLSADDVAALEARTEGWIAGLQLAALSLHDRSDTAGFIESFTGTHHFMMDYLLEEVLQQQPAEIQAFLLGTSILDRMCGPLCDALTADRRPTTADEPTPSAVVGPSSPVAGPSSAVLEHLERANLFVVPLDDERQWYRYHRLFADLLRQRLQLSTADVAAYHLRASHWYQVNGYLAEAFHHAVAAREFERAAALAEQAWPHMEDTFQTTAWLGWVKQLPADVVRGRPVLGTQLGWTFANAGDPETSERHLQDAERALAGAADRVEFEPLPGSIALARAYNAQVLGHGADTVRYAKLAQQLIPEEDVYRRAQAVIMLEFTHWAEGDLEAARRGLDGWMDAMRQVGNVVFVVASAFAVADIQVTQGRLREARRTYEHSLRLAAEAGPEAQAITAHHHLGLALLHHETDNPEGFARHWQQAEELGRRTTLVDWPHRLRVAQARVKQDEGDYDAALDLLDEAKRVYVKNPVPDLRPVEALKAQVYLRQGHLSKAQAWAHARGLTAHDDLSYLREFEHLTLARVLIAENQIAQAITLLDRLLPASEAGQRTGSTIESLIVLALAHQAQGDAPAARAALDRALTLAEPEGYIRTFLNEGETMRLLLADSRALIEKQKRRAGQQLIAYVDRLLPAFGRSADVQPSRWHFAQAQVPLSPQPLIEPLSPRELEVLRLIQQGLSNQEIADRLYLALSTVKGYTRTLFDKLQVQRRTEAVVRARELGLL